MNILLDVDDVVLKWHEAYINRYNLPMPTDWIPYDDIKDHLEELKKDKSFWLSIETKHTPNFQPKGYVSARGVPVSWTKETLKLRKLPGRSKVRHVGWGESKMDVLKNLKCELFIDDKYETVLQCIQNKIPALLMDTPQNRHIDTDLRIYDLNIESIMSKYNSIYANRHSKK